jgi:predicted N-acetyltransferase YhbS
MTNMIPLGACDQAAVEALLDDAFGSDRRSRTAYLLRAGVDYIPALSFGLMQGERLIGSIQCWPVRVIGEEDGEEADSESAALVLVGPVAVAPDCQGAGHGHALMEAMLDAAMLEGNPPLVMIGDAEYYCRFGFTASETGGWDLPGPFEQHRLLLRNEGDYILPISGIIGPDRND